MLRRIAVVLIAVALASPAVASADPDVPQPGAPCAATLAGAMTWSADATTPLACSGGGQWGAVADPYPVSDRWLSYGPALELHGQGRRNPSMLSGDWTATPLTAESGCRAEQVAVIPGVPAVGAPQVVEGQPGRPLSLEVAPTMATIELSGDCLWQLVNP